MNQIGAYKIGKDKVSNNIWIVIKIRNYKCMKREECYGSYDWLPSQIWIPCPWLTNTLPHLFSLPFQAPILLLSGSFILPPPGKQWCFATSQCELVTCCLYIHNGPWCDAYREAALSSPLHSCSLLSQVYTLCWLYYKETIQQRNIKGKSLTCCDLQEVDKC